MKKTEENFLEIFVHEGIVINVFSFNYSIELVDENLSKKQIIKKILDTNKFKYQFIEQRNEIVKPNPRILFLVECTPEQYKNHKLEEALKGKNIHFEFAHTSTKPSIQETQLLNSKLEKVAFEKAQTQSKLLNKKVKRLLEIKPGYGTGWSAYPPLGGLAKSEFEMEYSIANIFKYELEPISPA